MKKGGKQARYGSQQLDGREQTRERALILIADASLRHFRRSSSASVCRSAHAGLRNGLRDDSQGERLLPCDARRLWRNGEDGLLCKEGRN
jgi:hypothetical protein